MAASVARSLEDMSRGVFHNEKPFILLRIIIVIMVIVILVIIIETERESEEQQRQKFEIHIYIKHVSARRKLK